MAPTRDPFEDLLHPRSRQWEQAQRTGDLCSLTFRGVPRELRAKLNLLAVSLEASQSELGCLLLQFALDAYKRGELKLKTEPRVTKNALFLDNEKRAAE